MTSFHIAQLLYLLLDNNVFEYRGSSFFHQISGLAMGSKFSGMLAILVMGRLENDHIYQNILFSPWLYVRYIDATGTLAKNKEHAENLLEYLNNCHPTIKFDLETPDESGLLPILDTKIKIQEDGTLSTKIFTKTSNKGITIILFKHLYNIKRKEADKSALAEHCINQHQTATESPEIKVLCSTRDGLRLRIEEAYWIRRLQPAINRKKEDMGTGFLA